MSKYDTIYGNYTCIGVLALNDSSVFIYIWNWFRGIAFDFKNIIIAVLIAIIIFFARHKISQTYQSIIDFFRRKIKSSRLKKFIHIIARFFASTLFTVSITVICPYLIDCYNSQINIIVLAWIIGVVLNAICSNYIHGRNNAQKWFLTSLRRFKRINNDTAEKLFDARGNIPEIIRLVSKAKGMCKDIDKFYFRFDNAAKIACESMYNIIKDVTGYTEHHVTIYKRYQDCKGKLCPTECPLYTNCDKIDNKREWTKMIACCNEDSSASLSFEQEHCFEYYEKNDSNVNLEERKKHFYIHFFSNNQTKIEILTGKDKIRKNFLFHKSSITREEEIEQYIGIPLCFPETYVQDELKADINSEIRKQQHITYAVIQIDFRKKGILGKTDQSILEFVENVFSGIVAYLQTSLQVEEITKSLIKSIIDLSLLNDDAYMQLSDEYEGLLDEFNKNVDDYNELAEKYNSLIERIA